MVADTPFLHVPVVVRSVLTSSSGTKATGMPDPHMGISG